MSKQNSIELKPIVDEAISVAKNEPVLVNELGFFHSAASTMMSGAPAGPPVSSLPKTQLGNFLERSTHIYDATFATTDTFSGQQFSVDPWKLFLESTYIAPKVESYTYIRGSLEVTVSVNAPAGAYGMYIIAAVPMRTTNFPGSSNIITVTTSDLVALPHVIVDLALCTDGKIVLPWINWNDYALLGDSTTPDGYAGMWEITMRCFQPLGTATGTATPVGSLRMWARCLPDHDLVISKTEMMPNTFDQARDMVNDTIDSTRADINQKSMDVTGMKPSGVMGAIATGASMAGAAVPFLAPFAEPFAAVAGAIGSVLSFFGFTRDTKQKTPVVTTYRNYSNVANFDCEDTSEIAALSVHNSISYDPRLVSHTSEDQAAFNYLMSKYMLIGYAAWETSDQAQDEIISFPVTPFISRTSMDSSTRAKFTGAGYLGFPFQYWRGDMEYLIYIPMSKFHRGVLQVSWSPDGAATVNDITNTRYNHILDCSTCSNWEFTVGYVNTVPMLESVPHLFGAAITSTAGANGMITISVANPLSSPVETANTNVFVFARGCPNMEFGVPRRWYKPLNLDGTLGSARDFATGFVVQSGALGSDAATVKKFNLVPSSHAPIKELCTGERFDSVRALVQKFSQEFIVQDVASTSISSTYKINHFPIPPTNNQYLTIYPTSSDTTDRQYFTWAGYYSAMFLGIAGSVRRKFVNNSALPNSIGVSDFACQYGTSVSGLQTSIGTTNPVWSVPQGEGVEITTPYYYNRRFLPTWIYTPTTSVISGAAHGRIDEISLYKCQATSLATDYDSITGYVALGPDVRFAMFRLFPGISVATAAPRGWNLNTAPPG